MGAGGLLRFPEKPPDKDAGKSLALRARALPTLQAFDVDSTKNLLSVCQAVIDFWNPSCPRCVSYKPTFESVAGRIGGDVVMATAMTDDAPKAAAQYGLSSIPTTVFLANGQLVGKVEGEMSAQDLMAEISRVFGREIKEKPVLLRIVGGVVLAGLLAGAVYFVVKE